MLCVAHNICLQLRLRPRGFCKLLDLILFWVASALSLCLCFFFSIVDCWVVMAECASSSQAEKPVVVRVKRKATKLAVDALWLEISERPLKRPLLDFGSLSLSDSSTGKEGLKTKKVLVKLVETVSSTGNIENVLQSFMPSSTDAKDSGVKLEERRNMFRQDKKQDQLRSVARQKHEDMVRNARYEQLWKSRKRNIENVNDTTYDLCQLYDVVHIDVKKEMPNRRQKQNDSQLEDDAILLNYMPLIREFLPDAAEEIESDVGACSSQQDGYVYDFYTIGDDSNDANEDDFTMHPVVQVDDDDYCYDGPTQSEYESDDSNAEDNPLNDYPELSPEDEVGNRSSRDQSGDEDYNEEDEVGNGSSCDQSEDEDYNDEDEVGNRSSRDQLEDEDYNEEDKVGNRSSRDQSEDEDYNEESEPEDYLYEEQSIDVVEEHEIHW